MLGIRRRSLSSLMKRGWFERAKSTAGEAMGGLSGRCKDDCWKSAENVSVYTGMVVAAADLSEGYDAIESLASHGLRKSLTQGKERPEYGPSGNLRAFSAATG